MSGNINYEQLKTIFLKLTYILRGYPEIEFDDENSEAQKLIRFAYETNSQPFQSVTEGCSYLWIRYSESSVSKRIDKTGKWSEGLGRFLYTYEQMRQLNVHWTFYGESAQDNAFDFRQRLFSNSAKDFLDQYEIKLVLDVPECVQLFDEINNQWWSRVDLDVDYYLVTKFEEDENDIVGINLVLKTENDEYQINESED